MIAAKFDCCPEGIIVILLALEQRRTDVIVLIHICEMDMAVGIGIADPDVILPAHLIQYLPINL